MNIVECLNHSLLPLVFAEGFMVICLQQIHLIIALQTLNHQPLVANEGQCHSLSLSWLLNIACAEQELHTTQEIRNAEGHNCIHQRPSA